MGKHVLPLPACVETVSTLPDVEWVSTLPDVEWVSTLSQYHYNIYILILILKNSIYGSMYEKYILKLIIISGH